MKSPQDSRRNSDFRELWTDGRRTDGRTDGRRTQRHGNSSSGLRPDELKNYGNILAINVIEGNRGRRSSVVSITVLLESVSPVSKISKESMVLLKSAVVLHDLYMYSMEAYITSIICV